MAINMDALLKLSAQVDGVSNILNLNKALEGVQKELRNASTNSDDFSRASKGATDQSGLFNAATVALGNVMVDAAYKAFEFVQQSISMGYQFAQTETRLRMLSEGFGEYDAVQSIVAQNAETLGQSQVQAAAGFADIYARLRPLGVSLEDVNAVYLGFNSLAIQSGTTAEAASGAFMQLSQALGSGTLRGDEFNSVAEQVPGILMEVAEVMGQPVGALRELAADGKITSDVVIQAMRNAASEGGAALGELTQSAANAGNRLSVAFQDAQAMIGKELVPALAPFLDGLTQIVELATSYLVPVAQMVAEGWQWFASVITEQLLPALDPLIEAFQRAMGNMDITYIAQVWQGMMVESINRVIAAVDFLSPIVAGVVDLFRWLMDNPVFNFIAEQVAKVADGFVKTRQEAIGVNKEAEAVDQTMASVATRTTQVSTTAAATKEANEKIKTQYIEMGNALKQQTAEMGIQQGQIDEAIDLEKTRNDLLESQLERRLDAADSLQEEADILLQLRDVAIRNAELDYAATQASIDQQLFKVELQRDQLDLKYAEAQATLSLATAEGQVTEAHRQAVIQADAALNIANQQIDAAYDHAEVLLENAGIQKQIAIETANATYEQALAEAQTKYTNAAATQVLETTTSIVDGTKGFNAELEKATTHMLKLNDELVEVGAEIVRISSGLISAQQDQILNASAAYNYEKARRDEAQKILDLYQEGTQQAKELADALAGNLDTTSQQYLLELQMQQSRQEALERQIQTYEKLGLSDEEIAQRLPQYASGGYVKGPTLAMIGEGGEPEYVIPASKMASAASSYLGGARGDAVLAGGASAGMAVNIQTGPVMSMGGQQYVTKADLSMAVTHAVQQTMQLLGGNPSVRQSVGI